MLFPQPMEIAKPSDNRISAVLSEKDKGAILQTIAEIRAHSFYQNVRQAAKRNVPGADTIYEDLRIRFPGGELGPVQPQPVRMNSHLRSIPG